MNIIFQVDFASPMTKIVNFKPQILVYSQLNHKKSTIITLYYFVCITFIWQWYSLKMKENRKLISKNIFLIFYFLLYLLSSDSMKLLSVFNFFTSNYSVNVKKGYCKLIHDTKSIHTCNNTQSKGKVLCIFYRYFLLYDCFIWRSNPWNSAIIVNMQKSIKITLYVILYSTLSAW